MTPDGESDAGPDAGPETVDVDAGGAETIDRAIGAPEPGPMTLATRATTGSGRRRKPRTTGMFAETVIRDDPTLDDDPEGVKDLGVVLAPGTVLAGRYHVGELVGQGGMGTVYAARDADLDEEVALKLLRPDLARDDAYRARLRGEVRLARRVSHPNVCRVHDLGVADDLVFVTMELVRGRTLRQLLMEMRAGRLVPFNLAQVVDVLVQVGSALTAAHRAGVIHRDVKPDNIILTDGRAVLTDFGVATRSAERADILAGTPAYLAPEVLRHEPFNHKVDVYALAVVAYELLVGATPFVARTVEAATELATRRPPYPGLPESLGDADVRAALNRVLARGLASDPLLRTPSVERFTEAFALAARAAPAGGVTGVTGAGVTTPPPSVPVGDGTPPTGVRAVTTDPGSPSQPPQTRRPEVRVATALVWRRDAGADPTAAAEAAERVIVDAGGVPIRISAGEVIALFGAPRSLGDDADRAARAALLAVSSIGGRVGLDTTRVLLRSGVAELPGPEVAMGAAALAAGAAPGQVIASAPAARQLAARFEVEPVDASHGPGAGRRVAGVRAVAAAPAIVSFRARELAALDTHLERAFRERTPVCVEVRGAAGAGKTRLREALVAAVSARREVEWLVAVASPVGSPAPLSTVNAASREWYDAATGGGSITDPARRDNAARRWLEARATRRPVVVIVEDIQWADPSTRALLDHLRAGLDEVPVAIVTFARTDDGPAAAPAPGVELVTLGALDDAAATGLARSVAPAASADAIAGVVARAAGNPFFVEELARELADGGTTTLPPSIEAVIQARLDHLPEAAGQVALAAAVIGPVFWRSAVATLVELDGEALDAALAELERRGLVAATAPVTVDDNRYQFTQGLVRDVAYARIPPRERRHLHAAVATWLDGRTARAGSDSLLSGAWPAGTPPVVERGKDDVALVLDAAYHREQAGDIAGAAAAYRRAGTRCLAVYAYGEAASALRRAVALIGEASADAALHEDLGDALAETAGPAVAEAAYRAAAEALAATDAPAGARLHYKLGLAASRRGDPTTAIERFRAGLALAVPDGDALAPWAQADPRIAAQLLGGLGWTLGYQLARPDEGHPLCERAVAMLEATPHRRDLAQALSRLGGTYMRGCRFADQLRTNQRNLEIGRELRDLNMQLTANINLGVVHGLLGAISEAVEATMAARAMASRIGAAATAGLAASNLAGLLIEQGKLEAAEESLEEAFALIDRTGNRYVLCETFAFEARLAAARGDLAAARHHAERSRALARELASPLDGAVAIRLLAQIASRGGHHEEALAQVEEALAAAVAADAFEAARTRAARARVLRAAGRPEADAAIADAREELGRLGARRELEVLEDVTEVR